MLRDGRFRWSAAIVFLLLIAALTMGWKHYVTTKGQRDQAQQLSRESWLNQGDRNPHSAAHYGVYAFKPATSISLLDTGLDPYTGISIWVEAHNQNPAQYRPAEDATAVGRFGALTAAVIMQLLIPLLIILLTFNAFAGERENGTLRQLMSLGVSAKDLALGKILGIVFLLGILLVPAILLGSIALTLASENGGFTWSIPRFLMMVLGYLLYLVAFCGLGLLVSAVSRSSRSALIILLAFWILNCLIVPRVSSDIAERVYRTPTAGEFWSAVHKDISEGIDGHNAANQRTAELKKEILAKYGVTDEKELPININGLMLNAGEQYGNTVFDKHYGELWKTRYAQENVHNLFGLIAPFMPARSFSSGMAGTDLAHYQHFTAEVEQYRRDLNKMLNTYFTENSRTSDGYNYFAKGDELWEKTPDLAYRPPETAWALRGQIFPLSLLCLWCLGALSASFLAASRMKI